MAHPVRGISCLFRLDPGAGEIGYERNLWHTELECLDEGPEFIEYRIKHS